MSKKGNMYNGLWKGKFKDFEASAIIIESKIWFE